MSVADLPHVNASINTVVALLLIAGLVLIKQGRRDAHRNVMVAAIVLSGLFLASYLTYHYLHGSTKFQGQGAIRPVYFTILLTHTVLAVVNLPFIVVTVWRAYKGQFAKHRKVAKYTYWVWLYVAITGPIVYLLLYQLYPGDRGAQAFADAQKIHHDGDRKASLAAYQTAAEQGHVGAGCYAAVIEATLADTKTSTAGLVGRLAEHPHDVHCLTLLGREHTYAKELDTAKSELTRAVELAPDDAFAHASLAFAYFRGYEYEDAAAEFERAVALDATVAMYVYNAGYAHFLGGHYAKARPHLAKALEMGIADEVAARAKEDLGVIDGSIWICPMHPDERGGKGDTCGRCKMDLEPVSRGVVSSKE